VASSYEQAFAFARGLEVGAVEGEIAIADWELLEIDVEAPTGIARARPGRSYFSGIGD
jgi:hypothetical protein